MFSHDTPLEVPRRLADVPDPCSELYYPNWSSRGMRSVRCTRPAKATLTEPDGTERRVCGYHARVYGRSLYWKVARDG